MAVGGHTETVRNSLNERDYLIVDQLACIAVSRYRFYCYMYKRVTQTESVRELFSSRSNRVWLFPSFFATLTFFSCHFNFADERNKQVL